MMFGILALLYGFFYSLLQLQDYALLLGSLGLLMILATIMYLTRHIERYGLRGEERRGGKKTGLTGLTGAYSGAP